MAWKKKGGRQAPTGTVVRGANGARPRRVRSDGWQWNDEAEEIFFDALATHANVMMAAEECGFATPTVYRLRQKRADFAAKWSHALEQGYARLETAMVRAAADTMEGVAIDADRPFPEMTVEQAMNVLRAHRHELRHASATGRGPGQVGRVRPIEEVRDSILRKIEAIGRMAGSEDGE